MQSDEHVEFFKYDLPNFGKDGNMLQVSVGKKYEQRKSLIFGNCILWVYINVFFSVVYLLRTQSDKNSVNTKNEDV